MKKCQGWHGPQHRLMPCKSDGLGRYYKDTKLFQCKICHEAEISHVVPGKYMTPSYTDDIPRIHKVYNLSNVDGVISMLNEHISVMMLDNRFFDIVWYAPQLGSAISTPTENGYEIDVDSFDEDFFEKMVSVLSSMYDLHIVSNPEWSPETKARIVIESNLKYEDVSVEAPSEEEILDKVKNLYLEMKDILRGKKTKNKLVSDLGKILLEKDHIISNQDLNSIPLYLWSEIEIDDPSYDRYLFELSRYDMHGEIARSLGKISNL